MTRLNLDGGRIRKREATRSGKIGISQHRILASSRPILIRARIIVRLEAAPESK